MRKLIFLGPLLVFTALAGWLAVPLIQGTDPSALPSALIDRPAPPMALPSLTGRDAGQQLGGQELDNAALVGEVTLLNFFASWCVPCLAEHPLLTALAQNHDLTINAVAYKDKPVDTLAWLARHGDPFAHIGIDADGRMGIEWGLTGVPETFVIDAKGRVRYRHTGPLTPESMEETLLPAIEAARQ